MAKYGFLELALIKLDKNVIEKFNLLLFQNQFVSALGF